MENRYIASGIKLISKYYNVDTRTMILEDYIDYCMRSVLGGLGLPDTGNEAIQAVRQNQKNCQYLLTGQIAKATTEYLYTKRGVTIHVEDIDLITTILHSKLDSALCDVRIPFPMVDFALPSNVSLEYKQFEASGFLVVDRKNIDQFRPLVGHSTGSQYIFTEVTNYVKLHTELRVFNQNNTHLPLGYIGYPLEWAFYTDQTIEENIARIRSSPANCPFTEWQTFLDDNHITVQDTQEAMIKLFTLAAGLLLYCQVKQNENALRPFTKPIPKSVGGNAETKRQDCHRQHYTIVNLLPKAKYSHSTVRQGTHASPVPHWRGFVFRTLRNERYERNADGSCKVIMVEPCLVGFHSAEEAVTAERVVA